MSGTPDTPTELSISPNKLESFLPLLGAEVTEDGYIRDLETGEIATTPDGEELTIDEVGYLGTPDGDGTIELVEDDFSTIVQYLSENDIERDLAELDPDPGLPSDSEIPGTDSE